MRIRVCKRCEKHFEVEGRTVNYCPECSETVRREGYIKPRKCKICGVVFQGNPRAEYCAACLPEHRRQMNAKRRRVGTSRPIGSEDICLNCGQRYTVTSGTQKWCKDCAPACRRDANLACWARWRGAHKEAIAAHAREMRADIKACVVCGAAFGGRGPSVTCSDACAGEQLRRRKRANRKRKENDPNGGNSL